MWKEDRYIHSCLLILKDLHFTVVCFKFITKCYNALPNTQAFLNLNSNKTILDFSYPKVILYYFQ